MKPLTGVGGGPRSVETQREGRERPSSARAAAGSKLHFNVHPGMHELQTYAREKGWLERGFTNLSIAWQELVYTTDRWATTLHLRSTEVPCPIVNGWFNLPEVPRGTNVEFAIHVGVSCHAPGDAAGYRERGELWLNNDGKNFTQVSQ